jgi:hypothetical protein
MVDSISSFGSTASMGAFPGPKALTDEQKAKVKDILSKYDPNNLTDADAKSIMDAFKEAGIQPSKDLQDTIKADGFGSSKLSSMLKPHGHKPPEGAAAGTASTTNSINTSALQSLQNILSQYDLNNLTSDQQTDLVSKLNDSGLLSSGNTIDISA